MSSIASHSPHVAHHFDDAEQQFEAASLGMWAFLATEVLFFGGIFAGYALYRFWYPEAFVAGSHHLDMWLGLTNTAVLLISSLMMAMAVHAAQTSDRPGTVKFLTATLLLGSVFLGIKGYEYYHKFTDHLVPGKHFRWSERDPYAGATHENPETAIESDGTPVNPKHVELFYSFYFALTGLHAIHMIIGIGILSVLIFMARRGTFSAQYFAPVEISGLYWHFVDIVWVFLFPLLYLIR